MQELELSSGKLTEPAQYEVTGVRYQMGDDLTFDEQTRKAVDFIKQLQDGTPVILQAEPDNPKDSEAIAVYMGYTRKVGYIVRESCRKIKPLLDSSHQCRALVCGNDGHVTFFIEIPNAVEVNTLSNEDVRVLPQSPLPQDVFLHFSEKERSLQVVAAQLEKIAVNADTVAELLMMAKSFLPLSKLSLCNEDDCLRCLVMKKLQTAYKLEISQEQKNDIKELMNELNETIRDLHRSHANWQQAMFETQLEMLKKQAEHQDGLFEQFERYVQNSKMNLQEIRASLIQWFSEMSCVALRDYKNHRTLAIKLNYLRVSRRELYDVYAVLLLLERIGEQQEPIQLPDVLATDEAMKYWRRLQQAGFVDNHCLLLPETTRQQAMYIAEAFAEKLGVNAKWKTFQDLWHIKNLAQEKNKMQDTGKQPLRANDINKIFGD